MTNGDSHTYTVDNKGNAVGASYHKLMTFGSIGLLLVVIGGFI